MNKNVIVETRDLVKIYGDGTPVRALDGVNMKVWEGEMVAVMGPSGSGKSTLLHLIGALDRPTSGQVIVNGQDLTTVKDLDRFRSETVGFVFQLHNLIPTLTALENVEIPLYERRMSARERRRRAQELLELVGLGDRLGHLPNMLSGGERQRVAVARALANEPAIILADEPTGELDSERSREIIELMHRLNHELGTTFIVVTHDPAVARQTDRILVLDSGRIVREDILANPYIEDLKILKDSPLGRAILEGTEADLAVGELVLYRDGRPTEAGHLLKEMLERI
ncbi:MAG TPA: ABC transporter ATP-binding protein [Anaerolineae bacterium]|nr:ABC transporter ATP-binding protein [Anaerolineae bacterium]